MRLDPPARRVYRQGMRKAHAPWLLIGILLVSWAAGHIFGLILAVIGLGVVYFASSRWHPRTTHRACGGTGRHHSWLFPWTHRKCSGCDGGRIVRWGARRIGPQHIRAEHEVKAAARQAAKNDRAWR